MVALIAIGLFLRSSPESKVTMTLAGYSVDAPGKLASDVNSSQVANKGVLHRKTNSEFAISTKQVAMQGQTFELDDLIKIMRQQGTVLGGANPISRAGMNGYHITIQQPNGLSSESEMYKLNEQKILLLAYVSGNKKFDSGLSKSALDAAKTKSLDDPEGFFNSLREN